MTAQDKIISLLEIFIEEEDADALEQALNLVDKGKLDVTGLLQHLESFKGDLPRKRRAIMLVRKQSGLSLIPGHVCRRSP